jgi:hypothetical protein
MYQASPARLAISTGWSGRTAQMAVDASHRSSVVGVDGLGTGRVLAAT